MPFDKAVRKVATAHIAERIQRDIPLAPYTTLKIGGPAEYLIETHGAEELAEAIASADTMGVPVTILGGGSNVLISDNGIKGLVIINRPGTIEIEKEIRAVSTNNTSSITPNTSRWKADASKGTFKYDFTDLDYDESNEQQVIVEVDSGVQLPYLIDYLIERGITGLQWYSGIPGTVGGAVINNIHGGSHLFWESVSEVTILTSARKIVTKSKHEIMTGYNETALQKAGDVILSCVLSLFYGDTNKARYVSSEWMKRKAIQPRNSPGCAFCNLSPEDQKRLEAPTPSAGYIIEHLLGLSGFRVGDAAISKAHHNFIVNEGNATADDYKAVLEEIMKRALEKLNVQLKTEIVLLGFE